MCGMFVLTACLAILPAGRPQQNAPWDIPDRDRAARRFDPSASAARRARAIAEGHASPTRDGGTIFVLGRHNPELLMGTELLGMLAVVYAPETQAGRKFRGLWWQKGIDRFGTDFWTRLQEVAAPFIDRETETRRRLREGPQREAIAEAEAPSGTDLCLLRANALSAARERFGRNRFDAFLYEVVAPDAGVIETSGSPDTMAAADLALWAEGGCR